MAQFAQRSTSRQHCATSQVSRAKQPQEPVILASVPRRRRVVGVGLGHAFEQVAGHVGQVGKLFELALHVVQQGFRAHPLAHPAFEERLGGVPQIQIRIELAAETKLNEFEAAIRTVCEPIFEKPLKDISFGQVLMRLFQTARRFNMEVQPQLVLLQKTLLNIEGLGRQLYPDLDLWNTAQPFLERWMRERMSPKALLGNVQSQFEQLPHLANMTRDLLERMSQPHANDPAPPWHRRKDDWFLRLLGAAHLGGGAVLAAGGPLSQLGHWPAGIMVAVGLYLVVRR